MSCVFADTSFYQAFFNRQDEWHNVAAEVLQRLQATIVTTDYVLIELGALMSRGTARTSFIRFVKHVRTDPFVDVRTATPELLDAGLRLFESRPDKEWSLTDCISFALMEERGISEALTCDHHFEQAGFRLLLHR